MIRKRIILYVLIVSSFALLLCGCGESKSESTEKKTSTTETTANESEDTTTVVNTTEEETPAMETTVNESEETTTVVNTTEEEAPTTETTADQTEETTAVINETSDNTDQKVFQVEELSLTLDNSYSERTAAGYNAAFSSGDKGIVVLVLREGKEFLGSALGSAMPSTLEEYAALVRQNNIALGREVGEIKEDQGILFFEYEFYFTITYKYYTAILQSEDAFWLVQFSCDTNNYDQYLDLFSTYVHSVTFTK